MNAPFCPPVIWTHSQAVPKSGVCKKHFCILQMVKNWRQEQPGNKARTNTIPGSHVWLDGSLGMRLNDVHA